MDYPDPDVIRVDDTYYMVTTTMYFMPGCEILRSYDLVNWEHASYVYETLDGTAEQKLTGDKNIYGKGMWAASIRYHKNKFYVCFAANDTNKTYLYISDKINGPWEKRSIQGFYHDSSLLFDDDGKIYIVYGNNDIWLTQLKDDLSAPLEGGLHKIIISDKDNKMLGYEGSHFYKINNKYYVFLIHSRKDRWMRTEACFKSDSIDGEFKGGDVFEDDRNYCGQGVAQGGIVDTPDGKWFAVLFQDSGAVGRIPVLIPVKWENDFPVFGENGKVPEKIIVKSARPDYVYAPLFGSDDFKSSYIDSKWQFNHEPDKSAYLINGKEGRFEIITNKICDDLTQSVNAITQRTLFPLCSAEVTIDAKDLKEGDYAGICALQSCYGMAAITRREGKYFVIMKSREPADQSASGFKKSILRAEEREAVPFNSEIVRLKIDIDFTNMKDEAVFYYYHNGKFNQIGKTHKLYFTLDHFTGCRFALFMYAAEKTGGKAGFMNFRYNG